MSGVGRWMEGPLAAAEGPADVWVSVMSYGWGVSLRSLAAQHTNTTVVRYKIQRRMNMSDELTKSRLNVLI